MRTERGIPYSDEMVRAKLDGRKTVTRRLRGLNILNESPGWWGYEKQMPDGRYMFLLTNGCKMQQITCPFGKPGDILYGREAWRLVLWKNVSFGGYCIDYRADGGFVAIHDTMTTADQWARYYKPSENWRASIHMPKCYSRIWDEIVDVRPERLWDITEADSFKEGIDEESDDYIKAEHYMLGGSAIEGGSPAVFTFIGLWDSINAKRGYPWSSNPWVWRIETKEIER